MTVVLHVRPTAAAPALRLRPWRAGDTAALLAAHRDPELRRWLTTSLATEAEARRWVGEKTAEWADGTGCSFAVLEDAGVPLGHIAVKSLHPDGGSAEVGY